MTKDELEKLDNDLAREQKEIEMELKSIATENPLVKGDYDVKVEDVGSSQEDTAQEASELERNQAMVDELERRLKEIVHTRNKIKSNNYGKCENCSSYIGDARLKARSIAVYCLNCAKVREK